MFHEAIHHPEKLDQSRHNEESNNLQTNPYEGFSSPPRTRVLYTSTSFLDFLISAKPTKGT
jgi:hypothetical protein